jgi:hypothetical protein
MTNSAPEVKETTGPIFSICRTRDVNDEFATMQILCEEGWRDLDQPGVPISFATRQLASAFLYGFTSAGDLS